MHPVDNIEQGETKREEVPGGDFVKYSGKLDLRIFETDLAQLSILETELKERPVNNAALSLSFLQRERSTKSTFNGEQPLIDYLRRPF